MTLDDLGHDVAVPTEARRVVSLVPSITEGLAAARPGAVVGATDWCTHPHDLEVVAQEWFNRDHRSTNASFLLQMFMKTEAKRLIAMKMAMRIAIPSSACPVWLIVVAVMKLSSG